MLMLLSAFVAGLLFGTGLLLSGMTQPLNVQAFLDIAGAWNPSLALVMASAIAVAAPVFALIRKRGTSLAGVSVSLRSTLGVDRRLLAGSAIFGVGWGLAGVCPGPGILVAISGNIDGILFVASMLAGMCIQHVVFRKNTGDRG